MSFASFPARDLGEVLGIYTVTKSNENAVAKRRQYQCADHKLPGLIIRKSIPLKHERIKCRRRPMNHVCVLLTCMLILDYVGSQCNCRMST